MFDSRDSRRFQLLVVSLGLLLAGAGCGREVPQAPAEREKSEQALAARNVVLLIGDGMGVDHVRAASLYAHGRDDALVMQQMPHGGLVRTHSANGHDTPTDSAAAGTAMATGRKVFNNTVSMDNPGTKEPLETVLERAKAGGMRTGLVTTSVITHATPAAFAAHVHHRNDYSAISNRMLNEVQPDLLFGATLKTDSILGVTPEKARKAGYRVVTDRKQMQQLSSLSESKVSGQFHSGSHMPYMHDYQTKQTTVYDEAPTLSEMTVKALELLSKSDKGFFLMVEGARIDHAGHQNDLQRGIGETLEFDRAVETVLTWAAGRTDTLVIVVSDHETGGLRVSDQGAAKGKIPPHSWSTTGHTSVFVPIWATGVGAGAVRDVIDNTEVYRLMIGEPINPRKLEEIPENLIPKMPEPKKKPQAAEAYPG
ncbi:MAG: alkaline phosphatase [Phycisphaerae bacterium]